MTSELRPAVEVFRNAVDATGAFVRFKRKSEQAAAAVIEADREAVRAYWYRQGKDDGWQMCKENEIDRLREELAEAYIKLSGKSIHTSDCATSNAPAMEPGPCNCEENAETFARSRNLQTKRENVDMMALTETPYAEDFSMELFELIQHYRQRGLSDGWILAILKDAVEDREDDDD